MNNRKSVATPKYGSWDRLSVNNDGTDVVFAFAKMSFRLPWRQSMLFAQMIMRAVDRARALDAEFQKQLKEVSRA